MTDTKQLECRYKFHNKERFNGKPFCTCFCKLCEDIVVFLIRFF